MNNETSILPDFNFLIILDKLFFFQMLLTSRTQIYTIVLNLQHFKQVGKPFFGNRRDAPEPNQKFPVVIETDEGITGIAPLGSDRVKEFFPLLEGRDPREVFSIWKKMIDFVFKQGDEGEAHSALSAIDIALWDLKAKINSNKVTIGTWITIGHHSIVEILSSAKFDWFAIDMEHSPISYNKAQELIVAADSKNIPVLIFPGCFMPFHDGHLKLRELAEKI